MTEGILTIASDDSVSRRFAAKVERGDECWRWLGFVDKAGYARLHGNGKHAPVLYAHRISYELHKGQIPEGLQLDHLCRNRSCVNPNHLEAVTQQENIRRGVAARLHCPRGHVYDKVRRNGWRSCSICDNASHRRRWRERKAAA